MPFTLAHPAAILPLRASAFLRTAPLVIGAMAPDIPYSCRQGFWTFVPTRTSSRAPTDRLVLGYRVLAAISSCAGRSPHCCRRGRGAVPERARPFAAWQHMGVRPAGIIAGVWTTCCGTRSPIRMAGWCAGSRAERASDLRSLHRTLCHVLQYVSSVVGLPVFAIWYWRLAAPLRRYRPSWALRAQPRALSACCCWSSRRGSSSAGSRPRRLSPRPRSTGARCLLTHSLPGSRCFIWSPASIITLEHRAERQRRRLRAAAPYSASCRSAPELHRPIGPGSRADFTANADAHLRNAVSIRFAQCSGLRSQAATTSSGVMMAPLARFSPASLQR